MHICVHMLSCLAFTSASAGVGCFSGRLRNRPIFWPITSLDCIVEERNGGGRESAHVPIHACTRVIVSTQVDARGRGRQCSVGRRSAPRPDTLVACERSELNRHPLLLPDVATDLTREEGRDPSVGGENVSILINRYHHRCVVAAGHPPGARAVG